MRRFDARPPLLLHAQSGFVDERRRLEGVVDALASEVGARDAPQFPVHQWKQIVSRVCLVEDIDCVDGRSRNHGITCGRLPRPLESERQHSEIYLTPTRGWFVRSGTDHCGREDL